MLQLLVLARIIVRKQEESHGSDHCHIIVTLIAVQITRTVGSATSEGP